MTAAAAIRLRIREPGQGPDGLKLVAAGRAQLALLDISDLALAREQGVDVVAVGALVGKPLAALVAQRGIGRPRNLEHKTVGVSGLPSDPAFLAAVMQADGGDVRTVRQVTIGFSAVQRLLTGRVAAVPAFWNVEGVALRERGHPVDIFKVEHYGAPPYPEVVIDHVARHARQARRADIRAALAGDRRGRRRCRARTRRPRSRRSSQPPARRIRRSCARSCARSRRPTRAACGWTASVLERWATWDAKVGIVTRRPDVDKAFASG